MSFIEIEACEIGASRGSVAPAAAEAAEDVVAADERCLVGRIVLVDLLKQPTATANGEVRVGKVETVVTDASSELQQLILELSLVAALEPELYAFEMFGAGVAGFDEPFGWALALDAVVRSRQQHVAVGINSRVIYVEPFATDALSERQQLRFGINLSGCAGVGIGGVVVVERGNLTAPGERSRVSVGVGCSARSGGQYEYKQ